MINLNTNYTFRLYILLIKKKKKLTSHKVFTQAQKVMEPLVISNQFFFISKNTYNTYFLPSETCKHTVCLCCIQNISDKQVCIAIFYTAILLLYHTSYCSQQHLQSSLWNPWFLMIFIQMHLLVWNRKT